MQAQRGNGMFDMLQQLMGLGQADQQLRQGEQQLQQSPEEHAMMQRLKQAQLEHLNGENQMLPFQQDEAQFQQDHRREQYDQAMLLQKLHGMASLGQSGMLPPDAVDPTQLKMLLQKQLGFSGDPVHEEMMRQIEARFSRESPVFKSFAQSVATPTQRMK